ncbi:MAG: nuclear transport factor 2 family protein [Proteobacteria bacterium]|nr:nuclear transport factor 2 family protein [Pseudomonadota bacterium]
MPDPNDFRRAVEAHDLEAATRTLAEDAVLHSPVSFKPFEGRAAIRQLLGILLEVFEDFRYTDELVAEDGTRALVFRTRVGEREVEGIDLLRFDEAGAIRDFTVLVRPRSAVEALLAAVGARLAAAASGEARAEV